MKKFYVWPKRDFIAVAYAESTEEARKLLLEEIYGLSGVAGDGSMPCITRAYEAIKVHQPQIFAYTSTCEFEPTDSGQLEAVDLAMKSLLTAAENLYAFAEAFGEQHLTDEGKKQIMEAYKVLKDNGSKMFPPTFSNKEL